ncbi:neuroendocrine convertase 2-like [Ruditapes philippinarum]|uniref:neuroendocrine convertase 2-like n=1 Tax=Ruditapes philippinarum TaxID=129788 RepID=UPI00295A69A0|nr:neuroendocrine convertase 2-like [Ruditapes philippinarum]
MRGKFISGYLMDDTKTQAWIIYLIVNVIFRSCYSQSVLALRPNRVVVKVNSTDKQTLFTHLKTYGFTYVHKITPSIFTFEYDNNNRTLRESLLIIKDVFTDEVLETEPVRLYTNIIQPWDRGKETHLPIVEYIPPEISIQDGNGVGVSAVWSRGYSGRGVTVAVTGVGIDPYLLDLQKNLKLDLSFNYMYNKYDITPEYFSRSQSRALLLTDQGNNIAGLLAAEKDNGLCGAGIAYDSNIVGLTIFKVGPLRDDLSTLKLLTISDVIASALTHRLDDIDVFINAWIPSSSFDQLDLATRNAIVYGATAGRRGLGSVYVVPAGPTGNVLSNNIYTITVGVLDVNGTKQRNTLSDASVLTSGLMSSKMVTTSDNNRCIANFKGYSAAESQIGAIIALGIEANPRLSLREIQHLLVLASEHSWLRTNSLFKRNGAGHYFSEMFGFGVLNAEKIVTLSKNVTVNQLITKSLTTTVIT